MKKIGKILGLVLMFPLMVLGVVFAWLAHGFMSGVVLYQMLTNDVGRRRK